MLPLFHTFETGCELATWCWTFTINFSAMLVVKQSKNGLNICGMKWSIYDIDHAQVGRPSHVFDSINQWVIHSTSRVCMTCTCLIVLLHIFVLLSVPAWFCFGTSALRPPPQAYQSMLSPCPLVLACTVGVWSDFQESAYLYHVLTLHWDCSMGLFTLESLKS